MTRMIKITAILCALSLAACGGKKDGESGGESGGKPAEVTLAKLDNLKGMAPAGAKAEDGLVGGMMVKGGSLVASVDNASDMVPKTLDEATKDFKETYGGVENVKGEKLADGYIFSAENKGGMGTNYWVKSRREIGGKAYSCETTASNKAQQDAAMAFCKSLKK